MVKNENKFVFINCPFDRDNLSIITFTVLYCGFEPSCSREVEKGGNRLIKIINLIKKCKYCIHDLSLVELDSDNNLPRFNMPFECGLFYSLNQEDKIALILERNQRELLMCLSDLNGVDAVAHNNNLIDMIQAVRDWLLINSDSDANIDGADEIAINYKKFSEIFPILCKADKKNHKRLTYKDYIRIVKIFFKSNASI